jgi:hypothetical protein
MAQFIDVIESLRSGFKGVGRVFQFTNWDGDLVPYNCGQAAACTYLSFRGCEAFTQDRAGQIMRQIEADHPPDNLGGWMGTSRRRVERVCRRHGVKLRPVHGEPRLKESLADGEPVIVMLGVPGPKLLKRWTLPAGHWMVAYGYDETDVHLTNWGKMPWDIFLKRWNGWVPRLIGMRNIGLSGRRMFSRDREGALG